MTFEEIMSAKESGDPKIAMGLHNWEMNAKRRLEMANPINIIVEGCDNTGKTTLINQLSKFLGLHKVVALGPNSLTEQIKWINDQVFTVDKNRIFDRFPTISENVYGKTIRGKSNFDGMPDGWEEKVMHAMHPIIIYCRRDVDDILATFSEREQMEGVEENLKQVCAKYDDVMLDLVYSFKNISPYFINYDYSKNSFGYVITQIFDDLGIYIDLD